MDLPLRCRCGAFEGMLTRCDRAVRAVCYCRYCQAFARYLGSPDRTLDALGGTDIVATAPHLLQVTRGQEQLRCMTLTRKGPLRWYTACCRTPVGNTPRNPKLPYVGVVHDCIAASAAERDAAFGPATLAVNTDSTGGKARARKLATFVALLRIMRNVGSARLGGHDRDNPFFRRGTAEPVAQPDVLEPAQHSALFTKAP